MIWTQWHRIELILFGVCILSSVKSVDYYNPTDLWYEARKKADGFFARVSDIFAVQTVDVGHRMRFNDKTGLTRGTS